MTKGPFGRENPDYKLASPRQKKSQIPSQILVKIMVAPVLDLCHIMTDFESHLPRPPGLSEPLAELSRYGRVLLPADQFGVFGPQWISRRAKGAIDNAIDSC